VRGSPTVGRRQTEGAVFGAVRCPAKRANGYQVTGVHGCRKTGDGRRYFGDYVVN